MLTAWRVRFQGFQLTYWLLVGNRGISYLYHKFHIPYSKPVRVTLGHTRKKTLRFLRSNLGILKGGFMKYYYPEGFHTLQVCRGSPFWRSSCVRGDRATTSWPIRCLGGILEVQCNYGQTDLGMRIIIIQLQVALVSPDPKRSNFNFISPCEPPSGANHVRA